MTTKLSVEHVFSTVVQSVICTLEHQSRRLFATATKALQPSSLERNVYTARIKHNGVAQTVEAPKNHLGRTLLEPARTALGISCVRKCSKHPKKSVTSRAGVSHGSPRTRHRPFRISSGVEPPLEFSHLLLYSACVKSSSCLLVERFSSPPFRVRSPPLTYVDLEPVWRQSAVARSQTIRIAQPTKDCFRSRKHAGLCSFHLSFADDCGD